MTGSTDRNARRTSALRAPHGSLSAGSPPAPGANTSRGRAGLSDPRVDTTARILSLEQSRGFDNRAVLGGLEAYLRKWLAEGDCDGGPRTRLAERLADTLSGYADLGPAQRAARVSTAMALLKQPPGVGPEKDPAKLAAERPAAPRSVCGPGAPEPRPPTRKRVLPAKRPARKASVSVAGWTLDAPLASLHGVGAAKAKALARMGILQVRDLLTHFPRDHHLYPPPRKARDLLFQRVASFVGVVRDKHSTPTSRGARKITATLCDETGCVDATWFRGRFGDIPLNIGAQVAISGNMGVYGRRVQFESPDWEPAADAPVHTRRMVPIYPLTGGIEERWLRGLIRKVLEGSVESLPEVLPAWMLEEHGLYSYPDAVSQMHYPDSPDHLEQARRRLAFDELLQIQLVVLQRRARWRAPGAIPLRVPSEVVTPLEATLPFSLTTAQRRALAEILEDLRQSRPMTRLLQGDVGSGKTVVAAISLLAAVAEGAQGALMAPTEILAEQHYRALSGIFERVGPAFETLLGRPIRVALLTGSTRGRERARVRAGAADGSIDVLVGTQALVQDTLDFSRLALVVVDEQHRFGVKQRVQLRQKGEHPHMLVMTATPIPRTLSLTLYGDLDVSQIDELPPGRQPVETWLLDPDERDIAYERIRAEVRAGRQAFVICPLIEDSPTLEVRAATEEYERLRSGALRGLRLALLHGRMSSSDKEETMRAFRDGEFDVLVSTAVVEVGVDVPNATVMLVEGAERFGLSQLHQFRGRVGRGDQPAVCYLQTDQSDPMVRERLQVLADTPNGFLLAERDLEIRGPGDFFGVRQSGFPDLRMARLSDLELVHAARSAAERLLRDDPELQRSEHQLLGRLVESLVGRPVEAG